MEKERGVVKRKATVEKGGAAKVKAKVGDAGEDKAKPEESPFNKASFEETDCKFFIIGHGSSNLERLGEVDNSRR